VDDEVEEFEEELLYGRRLPKSQGMDKSLKITGPRDEQPQPPATPWQSGLSSLKRAMRAKSIRKTFKRVGWRNTIFEVKTYWSRSSSAAVTTSSDSPPHSPSKAMLYPRPSDKESVIKGAQNADALLETLSSGSSNSTSQPAVVGIDDFFLLKLIGKGNFGKVMLAQHKDNHKVYAIKVISKSSVKKSSSKAKSATTQEQRMDRIMTERNVLIRSVKHPFLIGLRWAFQTKEKLYFVTDYVNGGELFFHLQRERRFSELRSRFYAAEIVSALAYLHTEADVIYR
jgi:hypothetical protein